MNSCMSSAALEHLAWIELNFERGTPSAAREPSNRDSGTGAVSKPPPTLLHPLHPHSAGD